MPLMLRLNPQDSPGGSSRFTSGGVAGSLQDGCGQSSALAEAQASWLSK